MTPQGWLGERFDNMDPGRRNLTRERGVGRSSGRWRLLIAAMAAVLAVDGCQRQPRPPAPAPAGRGTPRPAQLQSWNDSVSKKAIVDFVARVTREGSADFVPPGERIATFDNDGTLWSEQPIYFQFAFALDRVKALAADHPEWRTRQPFKGVLEGDMKAMAAAGERGMLELVAATHLG